jgi:hypothetical protein
MKDRNDPMPAKSCVNAYDGLEGIRADGTLLRDSPLNPAELPFEEQTDLFKIRRTYEKLDA